MRRTLVLALAIAAGCGGKKDEDRPSGPVTAAGVPAAADATAIVTNAPCDSSGGMSIGVSVVSVTLADRAGLCAMAQAGETSGGMTGVSFGVARMGLGAVSPLGRGRWSLTAEPVPPASTTTVFDFPFATVSSLDATCGTATADNAVSGTLWIDSVSGTRVTGAIDAVLQSGVRLSGAFDVPVCDYTIPVESACVLQTSPPASTCL